MIIISLDLFGNCNDWQAFILFNNNKFALPEMKHELDRYEMKFSYVLVFIYQANVHLRMY